MVYVPSPSLNTMTLGLAKMAMRKLTKRVAISAALTTRTVGGITLIATIEDRIVKIRQEV
jgi:hypothetical protein